MSNAGKLAELRARTDKDLLRYVTSGLNLAARFAQESDGIRAEEAYTEIAGLLPIIHHVDQSERQRLEMKLQRLRELLDRLPALTS